MSAIGLKFLGFSGFSATESFEMSQTTTPFHAVGTAPEDQQKCCIGQVAKVLGSASEPDRRCGLGGMGLDFDLYIFSQWYLHLQGVEPGAIRV